MISTSLMIAAIILACAIAIYFAIQRAVINLPEWSRVPPQRRNELRKLARDDAAAMSDVHSGVIAMLVICVCVFALVAFPGPANEPVAIVPTAAMLALRAAYQWWRRAAIRRQIRRRIRNRGVPICLACGYDMTGLPVYYNCPECGADPDGDAQR